MSCFFFLCKYRFCKRCFIRSFPGIFQVMPGFSASYCIFILLFCAAGMISSARIHPQPALFFRRDYFFRPDSSQAYFFLPQGLFRPPRFIPSLLFSSAGIISTARIHPKLALFLHKDDFFRPDSSPTCFFLPQGLFRPPGFIPNLLFSSAGMISTARLHPQLALFLHKDDFYRPDSSPACSFSPQG
ncbi:unknown [Firmicutes bacterium CAG:791]|nr:unknown [Firmicutes bacterium CAG:791]